ncbi:MAG: fimbria/pilus periplasmic chaperone [Roseiarcus sp.]
MTRRSLPCLRFPLAGVILTLLAGTAAEAGTMQVSPVLIDLVGQQTATLHLRNTGDQNLSAQIRVFKWSQNAAGEDHLEPTEDVAASPPMASLGPRADYVVRLVRQTESAPSGEESYRVFIDELPNPLTRMNGVALVIRQSIPVFFASRERTPPQVTWRLERAAGKAALVGVNSGDRRVRISDLKLRDEQGTDVSFGAGLRGYVLGHSTARWKPSQGGDIGKLRGHVFVDATTEGGAIHVAVEATAPQ